MKCFTHASNDANSTCKFCNKGLCSSCYMESGYGLCCSEECKSELLSIKDMMNKSKMLYGQTSGRIPILPVMFLSFGVIFSLVGLLAFQNGKGYFQLIMGVLFLVLGVISLINQKKSGIRN